jgi:acyl-CoA synthetase (NDP forming)
VVIGERGRVTTSDAEGAGAATGAARRALGEVEAKRLLAGLGLRVPVVRLVRSADEAGQAAEEVGFPVVVKVASPDILHKSDVGGVALNVSTAEQACAAFERVTGSARQARPDARVEAALVEASCPPGGVELIVGVIRDPRFGPVVMCGLGGIFVEIVRDVAFRLAPIARHDALAMLGELRGARLLDGVRGAQPVSRAALADLLLTIAGPDGLALRGDGEVVEELDLNPVFAYPDGVVIADARIVYAPPTPQPPPSCLPWGPVSPRPCEGEGEIEHQPPSPAAGPWDRGDPGALWRGDSGGPMVGRGGAGGEETSALAETMRTVFAPRSVAVVGASTDELKLGARAVKHLVDFGYAGELYPIHPRAPEIYGRKAYPSLAAVPGEVERAIVTVAADAVPGVIDECVAKGVAVVHIYTAGFGEVSAAGRALERDLLARAAGSGLRIIGPNSIGTYAPASGLSPTAGAERTPGHISYVSQSGGLTLDAIRRGCFQGLRFRHAISIGNAIDLDPAEFLAYYADDEETRLIGAYVESVHDGQRLRAALESARGRKPVVILKGGQTVSGQRAAASHTGALADDFAIWQGLFRQTGVSAVQTIEELLDTLLGFQMLPPMLGPGVALIGPGGGASVTATDAADRQGLEVAPFAAQTVDALEALGLPPGTSLVNPLDVPASVLRIEGGAVLGQVLNGAVNDPGIHALVVHLNLVSILALASTELTAGFVQTMVETVIAVKQRTERPVCLVLRSSGEEEHEAVVRAERGRALAAGIPVYAGIEDALRALGHLYRYGQFCRRI